MGEKPLTWQQVVAVFILVAMGVAAVLAWGGNIEPEWRPRGVIAFWILLAIFLALLFSHYLKVNRSDLQPDMLADVFHERQILQLGPMHIWLIGLQSGGRLRLLALVQNTRGGDGDILLRFQPQRHRAWKLTTGGAIFFSDVPPLEAKLLPAAVIIATVDLALQPLPKPYDLRFFFSGGASARGETLRFARRRAITKPTSGWVTLLALIGGHIHGGGGTYVSMPIAPFDPSQLAAGAPPMWNVWTLWTPQQPMEGREIAEEVGRLLGRGMDG
jgi:hypothetical protein